MGLNKPNIIIANFLYLTAATSPASAERLLGWMRRSSPRHDEPKTPPRFTRNNQALDQLFGWKSIGLFCLPVLNSKILRNTPGAMAEIGLTRSTGWLGVPTTS